MINIFRSAYEQPENRLTYCFLSLLEHLDIGMASQILAESLLPTESISRLGVRLLYGGREANPDGSILLEGPKACLTVYFENKTWRRQLDIAQIQRHIRVCLNSSSDLLLVITTDRDHGVQLAALGDPRIYFMSWHQVSAVAERLAKEATDSKDRFLLSEFCEYLDESGEAWRAKMLDQALIDLHAQFLKFRRDEQRFLKECWRLVEAVGEEIKKAFDAEIETMVMQDHWGRLGNECELRHAVFGLWLFFGVLHDPKDHKIEFKIPSQAEFAIFLDIARPSEDRDRLRNLPQVQNTVSALKTQGFEFNFPEDERRSPWRLCYWREPMSLHREDNLSDLRAMFESKLRILFDSDFYRAASGTGKKRSRNSD